MIYRGKCFMYSQEKWQLIYHYYVLPLQLIIAAIAWSPHHHGLLASGGGTADRCIRFWNTLTCQPMQCVDTGSQVCNLAWSKHSSELVSDQALIKWEKKVWENVINKQFKVEKVL